MRATKYFLWAFLAGFSGAAFAGDCQIVKQVVLPVTFSRFVPTVPVAINGRMVNIGVDTGSEGTVITPEAAEELGLPKDGRRFTKATGTGDSMIVSNVMVDDLELAGNHYLQQSMAMIPIKAQPVENPESMVGLLGADVLSGFDLEFDVPAHTLTLYRVNGCTQVSPPWKGSFVRVSAHLTAGRRFVMPIGLDNNKMTAIFDTGSSGLRLSRESISKVGLTEDMLAADPMQNGSSIGDHAYQAPSHRFDSLVIAREVFKGPRIDIIAFPARDADMLVGEDYMHARRFWLSYATGSIFVQRALTR